MQEHTVYDIINITNNQRVALDFEDWNTAYYTSESLPTLNEETFAVVERTVYT